MSSELNDFIVGLRSRMDRAIEDRTAELEAECRRLRDLIAKQDQMNLAVTERLGLPPFGCDTADHLADEIEALREDRDRLDWAEQYMDYCEVLYRDKLFDDRTVEVRFNDAAGEAHGKTIRATIDIARRKT